MAADGFGGEHPGRSDPGRNGFGSEEFQRDAGRREVGRTSGASAGIEGNRAGWRAASSDSDDGSQRNTVPRDRAPVFFAYVAGVGICAGLSVGVAFADLVSHVRAAPAAFGVIALLAVLVDARPFATPGRGPTVFPSIAFTYALLLGWGLAAAVTVQVACVIVASARLRHAPWRLVFNASQYAISFAAAELTLAVAGVPPLSPDGRVGVGAVLAMLAGAVVWFVVNHLLVTTAIWLRFGDSFARTLMPTLVPEALSALALLALGPLVIAAANVSAALVPLMLIPLYTVHRWGRFTEEERRTSRLDELTGLPNRRALFAQMRAQARAYQQRASHSSHAGHSGQPPRDRRRMALLLLDIDQFRRVNDALGHTMGDRLLVAVADRLRECIGTDGFVARLGGDEFAVLAPRLADLSAAAVLAQRVADVLAEPVTLDGLPLEVTAAIGVAVYPDHGTENTVLLRRAEVAMYDAKDRASTYAMYTHEADENSPDRLELLADLRRALELGRPDEITLYYQPQIDLTSGAVVGVEALLRWRHPSRGMVSPDLLIKVAEHTAVMHVLTRRVMADVIAQLATWRADGLVLRASINVSVRDLQHPELVDQLAGMLTEQGVPPNQIQLEITEGSLMADPRRVLVTLHRLDRLGVALSLDDFGTGYSSLQHLRRLPLAEVKIDRSFVLGMATDPDDAAVVGSIIDLARALGLRVVAEGVEDDSTRRMLCDGGCEVAQGWFYARPMPADDLVVWLASYGAAAQARGLTDLL